MRVLKKTLAGREVLPESEAWIGVIVEVDDVRFEIEPGDRLGSVLVATDPNGPVKRLVARFVGSVRHVLLNAEEVTSADGVVRR